MNDDFTKKMQHIRVAHAVQFIRHVRGRPMFDGRVPIKGSSYTNKLTPAELQMVLDGLRDRDTFFKIEDEHLVEERR